MEKPIIFVSENTHQVWEDWQAYTAPSDPECWYSKRIVKDGQEDNLKAALQRLENEFNSKNQEVYPSWDLQKELNNIYQLIESVKGSFAK